MSPPALWSHLDRRTKDRLRRAYYQGLLRFVPSSVFCRVMTRSRCGYWPNLDQPRTFNEHLQRYKLTARDARMILAADKYLLREYMRSRIGPGYSPMLIARWDNIEKASCRNFPSSFVVKASHGSGFNHIVHDSTLPDEELRQLLRSWGKLNYYWGRREWVYRHMPPHFYAEEYLGTNGRSPDDYKAFVFGGRVEFVQVDVDRFHDHRRILLDREWRPLAVEYRYRRPERTPDKPVMLGEMIDVAETLGREFPFVRVDMYALPRRVIVGEMTFYPEGGFGRFGSRKQDLFIGAFWKHEAFAAIRHIS